MHDDPHKSQSSKDMSATARHVPVVQSLVRRLLPATAVGTALNPRIGYDKAAYIAKKAHRESPSLRAAAI